MFKAARIRILGVAMLFAGACTTPGVSSTNPSLPVVATELPATAGPVATTTAPSPTPAITGLTGHIVFSRAGGQFGEGTIFVINADGSDEKRLSEIDHGAGPFATHDGSKIAFASYGPETQNRGTVTITNVFGSFRTVVPLPQGTINLGGTAFSPDGKQILREGFDDSHPEVGGLYVTNVDGTGLVRLTQHQLITGDWSPDGKQILVFDSQPGQPGGPPPPGQLYVARPDGTHLKQLTPTATLVGCCGPYRYSPDGTRVLFPTQDDGIWTIGVDGSDLTQIFRNPSSGWAISPTWSPDGSMILFGLDPGPSQFEHPPNAVYVIRSDGTGLTLVLGGNDFKRDLLWVAS